MSYRPTAIVSLERPNRRFEFQKRSQLFIGAYNAASVHGHQNTPELRAQIKQLLKDDAD
jgi:hypothetical protein